MPLALVSPVLASLASVVAAQVQYSTVQYSTVQYSVATAQGLPTNSTPRLPLALAEPYVESYWESWSAWQDFPGDYAAFLKDVPATPIGSCQEHSTSHISLHCHYQPHFYTSEQN